MFPQLRKWVSNFLGILKIDGGPTWLDSPIKFFTYPCYRTMSETQHEPIWSDEISIRFRIIVLEGLEHTKTLDDLKILCFQGETEVRVRISHERWIGRKYDEKLDRIEITLCWIETQIIQKFNSFSSFDITNSMAVLQDHRWHIEKYVEYFVHPIFRTHRNIYLAIFWPSLNNPYYRRVAWNWIQICFANQP